MIRVVVDPSVFVSALIGSPGRAPDRVFQAFAEDLIEVVVSPTLIAELETVLRRPKFDRYGSSSERRSFVKRVATHATLINDAVVVPKATRDPDDDYLVALARESGVDAIVSLDRDLLEAEVAGVAVWTPAEFVERI